MANSDYISRKAFIADKRKLYCADCDRRKGIKNGKLKFCYEIGEAPCRSCGIDDALSDVEDYPAADVRPVVRCKDCKMQQYCKVAQYLGKDGFCSNGEKDVRSLEKCKLYKDCEYRTLWNCCCEDCNVMEG